jgi:eukaryotic-like serine/threonine-protein kinase
MTDKLREQLQSALGSTYSIGRELGGGGMSRVFVAEETSLGRAVVVKVLSPELTAGVNIDRFKREIRLAARLQHPHIVPVLQSGEIDGLPYFTMPFVEGQSLRTRLAETGALPVGDAVSILRDVAKALEYAHARDVVHRDIKPDNVLFAGNAAVVTDFGIAKALSASRTPAPGGTLTQAGTSLGTPAYMAPEQAAADPETDQRADIYAFGILAYELLAGQPPFAGRSPQKLLAAQLGERPAPIESMRPDVPPALAELVMRCLEKNADDRPQTAAALVRILDTVTTSGSAQAAPALLLGGRATLRNALLIYLAVFLIVALAARIATTEIGLPDWTFPGAVLVMLLGLPMILFTGYVQRSVHRSLTRTPTLTPGGTRAPASTLATLALKASPHVSWRRTAVSGGIALGVLVLLVAGYMLSWAMGVGPAGSLLGAGKMHARDRIVVTDFRGAESDTTVAGAASEAVRTDLSESPVITVLSQADVSGALRLMQRPPITRIDVPVAQDVAAREGAAGIVDGTITRVGAGYLLTLRLVSASGAELASFHDAADGPSALLPTLDRLARKLRAKIGESLKSVHAAPPLEQVTTSSLAALRKFDEGMRANDEGNADVAIASLREAVALDTSFAMAYRGLGIVMSNFGLPQAGTDSALAQAYRYRARLTERERYLAEAAYFLEGPGHDREQTVNAYHAMLALDPEDRIALNNLANVYITRRQYAAADTLFHRVERIPGSGALARGNLIETELGEGDTAAALRDLTGLRDSFPNAIQVAGYGFGMLYDRNDIAGMDSSVASDRNNQRLDWRVFGEFRQAGLAILRGQLSQWARAIADARRTNASRGVAAPPLDDSVTAAALDITLRGQPTRGVARLDALLARVPLRSLPVLDRPYFTIADEYALANRVDRARAILAEYAAEVKDTTLLRYDQPDMRAALGEIALAEHRPEDALKEFARADTAADGYPVACPLCFPLRAARAYDAAGNHDSAIAMYERYEGVMFRANQLDLYFRPLVYKRLGELYEDAGDPARAAANYRQFIALWKDADPDLQPVVADARRRLAKLSGEPTRVIKATGAARPRE